MPYSPYREKKNLFRERPWVFVFGGLLSSVAGFVNVVLLGIYHVPVSHMSGAVSRLAIDITTANRADLRGALAIFIGFLCGAILSGLIIGATRIRPGRRYGITMMLEGALLTTSAILLLYQRRSGIPLAAMACGLQNAMASSYYGLIIRTTHVSGMVTDIGVLLGQLIRYGRLEVWKLLLLTVLLGGFFTGGLLGGLAFAKIGIPALFLAAISCTTGGACYYAWRRRHLHEFEIDRWGIPSAEELELL
jgi:uncharacterized membrane protein YoaK (UPF0700 family)